MAYTTLQELELEAGGADRFKELTDWDGDGAVDAAVVVRAQASADGFIDGFLRSRSKTPVANPSETLKNLAAAETIYWIRYARGSLAIVSDFDKAAREDRIRLLEAHRDGKLRLDEPMPEKSSAVRSVFVENDDDVSRDGTKGMW